MFEEVQWTLKSVEPIDADRCLTVQRIAGRFRHTGIEIDAAWGAIITVRDGKILSAVGYATPERARRAAGEARSAALERRRPRHPWRGRSPIPLVLPSYYPRVWSPRPSLVAWDRMLTDAPLLESELPSWLSSEFESSDCWALLESLAPFPLSSEFESVTC